MFFAAHKRRKSSGEDTSSSTDLSAGPSKRPRVFFTEDQKETLRLAYQQDPYPNQQTIECLANQLGVSPKTIINWFHNHRMRAKQQVPGSGSGTPVKSEDDAMSNHSDSMSASSENSFSRQGGREKDAGAVSAGGEASTSQWMFPSFEPVRRSSANSEQGAGFCGDHNADHTDTERYKCVDSVSATSEKEFSLLIENNNLPLAKHPLSTTMTPAGASGAAVTKSKRKSAKPQWSYEGTQLDKSRKSSSNVEDTDNNGGGSSSSSSTQLQDVTSSNDDAGAEDMEEESESTVAEEQEENSGKKVVNTKKTRRATSPVTTTTTTTTCISDENENVAMETSDPDASEEAQKNLRGRLRSKKHLNCAIEKLQQAVNAKETEWDEETPLSPSS